MKLICTQLRLIDRWFQVGFVALFLCLINGFFFLTPDENFHDNWLLLLLIDAIVIVLVFSNSQVWSQPEQRVVLLRHTLLGIIPWRSTIIKQSSLTHVSANRVSDEESWPNCRVDLHWSEQNNDGLLNSKTRTIMQRRQNLSDTIVESKSVASKLGTRFVDNTKKTAKPAEGEHHNAHHDAGEYGGPS